MTTGKEETPQPTRLAVTLDEQVRAEIAQLRANGELGDGVRPHSRCYVCCDVESKEHVNRLLAAGFTIREIAESCGYINSRRQEKGDNRLIGYRHVSTHRREHFNLDRPVQAAYRAIYERRAKEANLDYENGIGAAITPYAVMETAMVKGYANLVDEDNSISVKDTLDAAYKFNEMTRRDSSNQKMADILYQMERLINAAQDFVPKDKQAAFLARVRGEDKPLEAVAERVHHIAATVRDFTPDTTPSEEEEI